MENAKRIKVVIICRCVSHSLLNALLSVCRGPRFRLQQRLEWCHPRKSDGSIYKGCLSLFRSCPGRSTNSHPSPQVSRLRGRTLFSSSLACIQLTLTPTPLLLEIRLFSFLSECLCLCSWVAERCSSL
jgi:hypothetical protein